MRKPLALVGVLVAAFATAFLVAPSADAASSAIKFRKIQYNPPGTDTSAKLNQEWVKLKNTSSSRTINIGGWKLHDKYKNHKYTFPSTKLSPGETVKVHTGSGTRQSGHRYWGKNWYVWNNGLDTATLRRQGVIKDRCGWTSTGNGVKYC